VVADVVGIAAISAVGFQENPHAAQALSVNTLLRGTTSRCHVRGNLIQTLEVWVRFKRDYFRDRDVEWIDGGIQFGISDQLEAALLELWLKPRAVFVIKDEDSAFNVERFVFPREFLCVDDFKPAVFDDDKHHEHLPGWRSEVAFGESEEQAKVRQISFKGQAIRVPIVGVRVV
jgi:hypothetical protein